MGIDLHLISQGYGHKTSDITAVYLDDIENEEIDNASAKIIA
jgi:hypothetical protein